MYVCVCVCVCVYSQEMCDLGLNITMCPMCDTVCDYWPLSIECSAARASYLFDNTATVMFAIFMSLWGEFICVSVSVLVHIRERRRKRERERRIGERERIERRRRERREREKNKRERE